MVCNESNPVFILGCAWRCGSTLLQRLVSSTNEVFVWGEHDGFVNDFIAIEERLLQLQPLLEKQRTNFQQRGLDAWVANINPPLDRFVSEVLRELLDTYYKDETHRLGYPRWGFKEVRYDFNVAKNILLAFPQGKVLFLMRPLQDVLASNAVNEWYESVGGPVGVTDMWIKNVRSFLERSDHRIMHVHYEDLAMGRAQLFEGIQRHIGLNRPIQTSLLTKKVRAAAVSPHLTILEHDQICRSEAKIVSQMLTDRRMCKV